MGYLQTLQLMVRAYKAARGVMPKGLDMLKLKQKARQKVIDAKKVINVDFSKGRKFYEEGIGDLIRQGKLFVGKAPKTKKIKEAVDPKLYEQMRIKEIMKQNKESAKRLEKKMNKEKDLGDKLKDYKGDPDAMAGGGKVKKPFRSKVVDFLGGPSVVGAELGLSGLLEVYNLLGMPLMKDGGIMELATGGMTNISDTYDNNPTLQAQYPNKQDYLDLFTQQTTTTTPQTNTTTQSTTSTIAPINPINPIISLPQDSGDGGGGILNNFGRTNMNQPNAMGGKEPGIVAALQRTLGDVKTAGKEIYSLLSPMQMAKRTMDSINNMRAKQAAEIIEQIRQEEEARLQAQLNRPRVPGGTIDSGNQGSGGYGGTGGEGPSAVGSSGMLGGGV